MQRRFQVIGGLAVVLASALMAHAVEQSSWGQVKKAFEGDSSVAGKVVAPQGKGTVKPFELAVEALQDVDKVTDVTVTTKVVVNGFAAPTLSKHIQLKSFDTSGALRWTKNQMNVALAPNGSSSSAGFQYRDLGHNQPFQVQEQVQNAQTGNTEVLDAKGIVRLRPDVSVGNVSAPAQVHIGQIVNIVASIDELNGDLGATTNVVLNEGATARDHADGISVNPLGNVDVVFATRFDQPGTYELTVLAKDVVPGEYDGSNNAKSVTIEVTGGNVESVPYYLGYSFTYQDYSYNWNDGYSIGASMQKGQWENLWESLYLPGNSLTFPVDKVSLQISADNGPGTSVELTNIPAQYEYNDGWYSYGWGSAYAGDNTYVYLQYYVDTYWGYSQGYASFNKYAEEYVYSYWYQYYWGETYGYSAAPQSGTFLNATNKVDTRFVVEDDGRGYGGNASTGSLSTYPWDYTWNDWYGYGYNRGYSIYGYSNGVTQP